MSAYEAIDCSQSRAVIWDCACGERRSLIEGFDDKVQEAIRCSCGREYLIRWLPGGANVLLIPSRNTSTIEQKHSMINCWLRHHPDHQVLLRFCGIYGCAEIEVIRGNERIHLSWGNTLEKRLDEVLRFLGLSEEC